MNPSHWNTLYPRYADQRPRKILSLDGGGIRGVITLGILAEMEEQLKKISGRGDGFRLCDYFDYIGGTSTGAIIAAGLARGKSVQELLHLYDTKGQAMFDKAFLMNMLKYKYKSGKLIKELKHLLETDVDLSPQNLQTLLLIMTMNVDTDSPWPISSNPDALFNDPNLPDCNLRIPLWQLVKASTAAPSFFGHEELTWDPDNPDKRFAFVDGGMTPHNNPAWLMYRMATFPAYNLNWQRGESSLLIVSVGTGIAPNPGRYDNIFEVATQLPMNLLNTMKIEQDINCRQFGRCTHGAPIDIELGDMIPRSKGQPIPLDEDLGRDFLYTRYDVEINQQSLNNFGLTEIDARDVEKMDAVKSIPHFKQIGKAAAAQVNVMNHFGNFASAAHFWPPA